MKFRGSFYAKDDVIHVHLGYNIVSIQKQLRHCITN
jgi:hypothetical protein